ncbi:MAG: tetratricopeptide repeat protein [Deltaproteobacteria bacterium]|nr:tetratricopeptide repeat protein [Deltaproteobacteria bacterium]
MEKLALSPALCVLILLILSFGVYLNSVSGAFVFDDNYQVLGNPWIKDVSRIPEIFTSDVWAFKGVGVGNYYRPLMHLFYMLSYHVFGLKPWGFHLVNMLFHAGVSVLVFLVALRLFKDGEGVEPGGSLIPAFVAAVFFAVHPIHTEAVAWIAGLPEVSFTFFYLLSFYLYTRAGGTGQWGFGLSLVFFFMAALSKETALTLPLLIFAYDYSSGEKASLRSRLKRYIPYLLVAGVYFVLRTYAIKGFAPLKSHSDLSGYEYFINIFPLFVRYLGKLVLPVNMNALYVFHPVSSILEWKGMFALIFTLAFAAFAYYMRKRSRLIFLSLLWIALPLLPVLYIPALGKNAFADRYLYLPSAGFTMLLSMGLCRLAASRRKAFLLVPVVAVTGLYSAGTIKRNPVWKDGLALWGDVVRKSPDAYEAHENLGAAYHNLGLADEAVKEYLKALELNPYHALAHYDIGVVYGEHGLVDKAIEEYRISLRLNPYAANAHNNLGSAYYEKGLMDEAVKEYLKALELNPYHALAHYNIGVVYGEHGLVDKAIEEYRISSKLDPDYANAHNNLGRAYYEKGLVDEAVKEYRTALMLNPVHATAHNDLGRIYYEQGRTDEAVGEFKKEIEINPGNEFAHKALESIIAGK